MGSPAVMAIKIIGDSRNAQKAFSSTEKAAHNFSKRFGKFGPVVQAGFMAAAAAAPVAAAAAVKAAYDIGEEFDTMSDTIRVGTGATGDALADLVEDAKAVGAQVPASFEDVGSTLADVNTRLGLSGESLQTVTKQYLEAGRILGEKVDINTTTAAFTAFGVAGEETSKSLDTLFRVSQDTGIGMNDLAGSLQKHSPTLQSFGFSFDQAAALVGAFDKTGIDTNKTLSAMGSGLSKLAQSGEEPAQAFERVTGEIGDMVKKGDEAAALDLASKLFGTRGAGQFVQAVKDGTINLEQLSSAAVGSGDTILDASRETMDAAEHFEILKNNAKLLLEPLASKVFETVGDALGKISEIVQRIDLKSLGDGFNNPAFNAAKGVFVEIGKGFQAIIAALIPFGQALYSFLMPTIDAIINYVRNALEIAKSIIGAALDIIKGIIQVFTGILSGDWAAAWDGIKQIVQGAWDLIKGIVSAAFNNVKGIFNIGLAFLSSGWSAAWNTIKGLVSTAWTGITGAISSGLGRAVSIIGSLPGKALRALGSIGSHLYGAGRDLVYGFINGIGSMAGAIWDAASNIASQAISGIKSFLGIASPSKVFEQIGVYTGEGFEIGLNKMQRRASTAARNLVEIPRSARSGMGGSQAGGNHYEITINGVIDKISAAREIEAVLKRLDRNNGVITL